MCTNRKTIVNRTKDFRSYDKLYIDVNCGECEECRNQRHYDFYMRIIKECSWCIENGYNIYFSTHTYDDEHLPKTMLPIFDENWKLLYEDEIKCFDSHDWGVYYDSIVKKLRRKFGIGVNGSPKLRYFVASEFGSLRGRPHLHIMWFCPSVCSPADFYDIVKNSWSPRGLIFPRSLEGESVWSEKLHMKKKEKPFQVNRPDCNYIKASYYVAKYVCKDNFFYSNENIVRYLKHLRYKINGLKSIISQKMGDEKTIDTLFKYQTILSEFKTHLPFHHCSHGFGLSYIDDFKDLDFKGKCDKLIHGIDSISDNCEIYNFRYPSYIQSKLLYDIYILNNFGEDYDNEKDKGMERHVRRELNEFGKFYMDYTHKNRLDKTEIEFRNSFDNLISNKKYIIDNKINLPNIMYDDKFFRNLSIYYNDIRNRVAYSYLKTFPSFKKNSMYAINNCQNLLHFDSKSLSLLEERKRIGLSADTLHSKMLKHRNEHYLFNNKLIFKDYEDITKILLVYSNFMKIENDKLKRITRLKRSTLIHNDLCFEK